MERAEINPVVAAWEQASEADKVVFREWFDELEPMADDEAEPNEVYELGRLLVALVGDHGRDDAIYVLAAGITEAIAVEISEYGRLAWMISLTDQRLLDYCIEGDGSAPDLENGALDGAREKMKAAGLLSWVTKGTEFIYLLKPPLNWLEMLDG